MSDGPYKSLPMKPRWRHAAKCAYKEAFSSEEIVESATRAAHADWRAEVRQALVTSVTAVVAPLGQQTLFADQALSDLAALRRNCASPLEASFVRNAIDAVATGLTGGNAVQFAAEEALSDRLLCNYRQVEEHVRRDDSIRNAEFVRNRFEAAHGEIDLSGLAQAALRTGGPLNRRIRTQFTDLDAGVPTMIARTYHASRDDSFAVDVIELGADVRDGAIAASLGAAINLSTAGLESYFYTGWHPELVDLLVIAAAVEYCDLSVKRPAWGWARSFDLRVAVHTLDRWEDPAVQTALEEALSFLTGHQWIVSFVQRARDIERVGQGSLGFDVRDRVIMPYSDGVDSRAVSALVDDAERGGLVRVRLGTKGADTYSKDPRERRFMTVPYQVRFERGQRVESSARSRGFKFAVVTGIAAALANVDRIVVTESGQGALGPILVTLGQSYPDYRVHPAFTRRVEALFEALTGKAPRFEYPRIWSTKGETIAAAQMLTRPPNWANTRSCWQGSRQVSFEHKRRQCGICAACMLRRLSMHAANVEEPAANYIWEDLSAPEIEKGAVEGFKLMTPSLREHAIAGVLHLDHLASLSGSNIHGRAIARVARETADALRMSAAEAEANLLALLVRHCTEWLAFQESLGPESFVTKLAQVSPWQR